MLTSVSGFHHSAFSLRGEGRLEQSPNFQKIIPRGELIELLSKAQLYREVEAHWTGDSLITNCKTRFSLLETHVCSHDGKLTTSNAVPRPLAEKDLHTLPISTTELLDKVVAKRKSEAADDRKTEKRAKKDDDRVSTAQSTPVPERMFNLPLVAATSPSCMHTKRLLYELSPMAAGVPRQRVNSPVTYEKIPRRRFAQ